MCRRQRPTVNLLFGRPGCDAPVADPEPAVKAGLTGLASRGKGLSMPADGDFGPPTTSNNGVLARHPLVLYFIIAYAGSWLVVLPYLRFGDGAGLLLFSWPVPFAVSAALAPFAGPCLAAFILTGVTEGRAGIRRLLRRIVLWRVGFQWYLFALVAIPAITMLGAVVLPGVLAFFQTPALSLLLAYPTSLRYRSDRRPVGRRAGLAGVRAASTAATARSFDRKPHFRDPLGLLAPAVFLDAG